MSDPWWTSVDETKKKLAIKMAQKQGVSEADMCLPYPGAMLIGPSGYITHIRPADLVPVWVPFFGLAGDVLQLAAEAELDQSLGAAPAVEAPPKTADDMFREDRGLTDGEGA